MRLILALSLSIASAACVGRARLPADAGVPDGGSGLDGGSDGDGGLDADAGDAGTPDGSVSGGPHPDGGVADAGAADAGAGDAGAADAGSRDAGAADAGSRDAGSPDAGTPDAGTPDAGSPDAGSPDAGAFVPLRHSPIEDENLLPGGTGWHLNNYTRQLGAYCDRTSYLPGQTATIFAAGQTASVVRWQLWRVGYYDGLGGRLIASGGPAPLQAWTTTQLDPATGAVRAPWAPSFQIAIPASAVTGVYLVKLSADLGETYATLVVRDPQRQAAILYPVSTNTYQAYNPWGGTSLYENTRSDWSGSHAYAVSFDRPYQRGAGAGELLEKDLDFITFTEGQGYDVAYVTDTDLDADPGLVNRRRMIAVQGHSEYWTAGMRDAIEGAIAYGTSAAFFAANNAYWQVRFQDSQRRTLIGYKDQAALDPAARTDPAHVTTRWRNSPVGRPENAMIGEMFGTWISTDAPLLVTDPTAWPWTGAGVRANSIIAGVYGDEIDRRIDNGAQPAGVQAIADGFAEGYNNASLSLGETTLYTAPSGAEVFSAGSITWSRSLAGAGRWDARVQQLVANLFSRFGGDGTLGPAALRILNLPAGATTPTYRSGVQVTTVTRALTRPVAVAAAPNGDAIVVDGDQIVRITRGGVATLVAGGASGYADGPAAAAQFNAPHGVAVNAAGDIYVSDTNNQVIRVISAGIVRTLAGSGTQGFADGLQRKASFSQPMGIAFTADGTLLVADMWNQRLRAVSPAGLVSTWAGTGSSDVVNGPGSTAGLSFPFSVTVLPSGDAVLAEPGSGLIRRVSGKASHDVSVIAGTIGESGWVDGQASSALVSETLAVAALADGQIALIDGATARIRAIRTGVVDTLAGGSNGGCVDGTGASAGFGWPRGLATAPDGALLVVDVREHSLRVVTLH